MTPARNSMIARTRAASTADNAPGWQQRRLAFDACHSAREALGSFNDALTPERADAREKAEAARRLANAHDTVAGLLADLEQALSERDGAIGRIADLRERLEAASERLKMAIASSGAARPASKPVKQSRAERAELQKMEHTDTRRGSPTFDAREHQQRVEHAVNRYYDKHPPAPTKRPLVPHQDEARAAMIIAARKQ